MRSAVIYFSIFAFIIFVASFASRSQQLKRSMHLERLQQVEVAEARQVHSDPVVLGLLTNEAPAASISAYGQNGQTVLKVLQDSHVVIVEYTDEGARVKGIDGAGNSEPERETSKKRVYTVNGKTSELSPDRYITHEDDVILWQYVGQE
jgi:hypothetical protein